MRRVTWLDRFTRWATLWSMVLATLAPGIAHALRHERGQGLPWQEICTTTGAMRTVAVNDDGTPVHAHAFEQCLTCLLHHGGSAPPPSMPAVVVFEPLAEPVPRLFLHASQPLFAWHRAQPRAPPSAS